MCVINLSLERVVTTELDRVIHYSSCKFLVKSGKFISIELQIYWNSFMHHHSLCMVCFHHNDLQARGNGLLVDNSGCLHLAYACKWSCIALHQCLHLADEHQTCKLEPLHICFQHIFLFRLQLIHNRMGWCRISPSSAGQYWVPASSCTQFQRWLEQRIHLGNFRCWWFPRNEICIYHTFETILTSKNILYPSYLNVCSPKNQAACM